MKISFMILTAFVVSGSMAADPDAVLFEAIPHVKATEPALAEEDYTFDYNYDDEEYDSENELETRDIFFGGGRRRDRSRIPLPTFPPQGAVHARPVGRPSSSVSSNGYILPEHLPFL